MAAKPLDVSHTPSSTYWQHPPKRPPASDDSMFCKPRLINHRSKIFTPIADLGAKKDTAEAVPPHSFALDGRVPHFSRLLQEVGTSVVFELAGTISTEGAPSFASFAKGGNHDRQETRVTRGRPDQSAPCHSSLCFGGRTPPRSSWLLK